MAEVYRRNTLSLVRVEHCIVAIVELNEVMFCIRARLQPCRKAVERNWASAPVMARPARNAAPDQIVRPGRIFFATTKTSMGRRLLQSERNAMLLIDVLRSCVAERKLLLHDFVVMPDHAHLPMTVPADMTIERAMQFIKGRFSYRLKRELGFAGEVWQRGFSEARADDPQSFSRYRDYIALNPVKAGIASCPEEYPFCYNSLVEKKAQGLKPSILPPLSGTAKAMP